MSDYPTYIFDGIKFEIKIEIPDAFRIKVDHGINLLNLFEGENLETVSLKLTLDDEKAIELWWDYVGTKFTDREDCINKLTRDSLTKFKEAFWAAVVNFSDPAGRPVLLELKKRLPGLLKQQVINNLSQLENSQQNETSSNT